MANADVTGRDPGRREMGGRVHSGDANELVPGLPGPGSGNGPGGPHGLDHAHHPPPEQHQRASGVPRRSGLGHGPAGQRSAGGQRGRPPPHPLQRVVPQRPAPRPSESDPPAALRGLPLWASLQRPDLASAQAGGPGSPRHVPAHYLERVSWDQGQALQQSLVLC